MTAPLTGYAERISVRAGEKIAFKVSSVGPGPYHAMLVRIVRGDPSPAGPPAKIEDESELFDGRFASREQRAWPGSYALIEGAKDVKLPGALAVEALIWPTLPDDGPQTVVSRRDPATGAGFALVLTPDGMALESGTTRVVTGKKLRSRAWYRVWASADPATGMLRVGQQPLRRAFAIDDEGEASKTGASLALDVPQPVMIGAEAALDRPARHCFNGKIEAPGIAGVAAWDFARRMDGLEVEDSGPNGLHGRLINLPTRAMKGAAWTGKERNWQAASHEYAAPAGPQAAGQGLLSRRHLPLSALHQLLARRLRRAVPPARRRLESSRQQSRRAQGLRARDLQLSSRRLGRGLLLAPAAPVDLAAGLPVVQRPGGLRPASSAGRHASHRLARSHGHRLRRRHRPRPA